MFFACLKGGCEHRNSYFISILVSFIICAAYISSREFPAGAVGLYFEASDSLLENGWVIPGYIPNYSVGGIPFAYNPLPFYVSSIAKTMGLRYEIFALFYGPAAVFASSILAADLVYSVTDSEYSAVLAPSILACYPVFLSGHITAGGMVRATALAFSILSGIFCLKYCSSKSGKINLFFTSIFLSASLLSHPTYGVLSTLTVVTAISYYCSFRRFFVGNFFIGTFTSLLFLPWVFYVANIHGIDVFLNASSSQGGIFPGIRVLSNFNPFSADLLKGGLYFLSLMGGGLALLKRRYFVPLWGLIVLIVLPSQGGKGHALFLITSTAYLAGEGILRNLSGLTSLYNYVSITTVNSVVLFLLLTLGLCYTSNIDNELFPEMSKHYSFMTGPETVIQKDRDMYSWVRENTRKSSEFIPVGSGMSLEGFPFWTDRTMVLTAWGSEWLSPSTRKWHLNKLGDLRSCVSAGCLVRNIKEINLKTDTKADYFFFSDRRDKVSERAEKELLTSIKNSSTFSMVYRRGNVYIVKISV